MRRRRKNQFSRVRREFVYQHYELLFDPRSCDELCMICLDPGLSQEGYLKLKTRAKEKGGRLSRISNKHSYFSNFIDFFGGGNFLVEWGKVHSFKELKEKKEWLEEEGCIILVFFHQNRIHSWEGIEKVFESHDRLKRRVVTELREKIRFVKRWRRNLQVKTHAYFKSIKERSKKTSEKKIKDSMATKLST